MTNRKKLKARVSLPASQDEIDSALFDVGLNVESEYLSENSLKMDNAAIEVLIGLKATKSVTEGGYNNTTDLNAINERIQYLARRAGRVDLLPVIQKPTISNASHLW